MGTSTTRTATRGDRPVAAGAPRLTRRSVLAALTAVPVVLVAGCAFGDSTPDPLIALALAAHDDADLVARVLAEHPGLAEGLEPLRAARGEHAAALDEEVRRLDSGWDPAAARGAEDAPAPVAVPGDATGALAAVRDAVTAAATAAGAVALDLPVHRVGLVAAVSACCATYAAVLA